MLREVWKKLTEKKLRLYDIGDGSPVNEENMPPNFFGDQQPLATVVVRRDYPWSNYKPVALESYFKIRDGKIIFTTPANCFEVNE